MNRKAFFDDARRGVFGGRITRSQMQGAETLLDAWAASGPQDLRGLAYCLATAYHETAHTLQPIREYGRGRGRPYGVRDRATGHAYFGRGYVQLTWKTNYARAGQKVGLDLVAEPDLALDPAVAAKILILGMDEGWFTGKRLADYFTRSRSDWINARRIVNGTDRASLIAGYARAFHAALVLAQTAENRTEKEPVA